MRWNIIFVTPAKQAEKPKPAKPRFDFRKLRRASAVALVAAGLLAALAMYLFGDHPEVPPRLVGWSVLLGACLWAD